MLELWTAPPFMVDAAKPPQVLKEALAESRFQPRKILRVRRSGSGEPLPIAALSAEGLPNSLASAGFDAEPDELTGLRNKSQMRAAEFGGGFAKRTVSLVDHGTRVRLL